MNTEVKKLWLDALRSGEYKQSRYRLRDFDGFCCLGVLCDLHAKATDSKWDGYNSYYSASSGLPNIVCEWAELPHPGHHESCVPINKGVCLSDCTTLTSLNDCNRWSFNKIADLIEEKL